MMKMKPYLFGIPVGIAIFVCLVILIRHQGIPIAQLRELQPKLVTLCGRVCSDPFFRKAREAQERSKEIKAQVYRQLELGMDRREVESIVHKLAWIQYKCGILYGSRDIYLFGSHDPDLAGILWLDYEVTTDGEILGRIASFDGYQLEGNTNGCEEILLP